MNRCGMVHWTIAILCSAAALQAQAPKNESTHAVGYQVGGSTKIDFKGTDLMPESDGGASVRVKKGYTAIDATFDHLRPATKFGAEFLTYVLWAVSPEGRTNNLGEILTTPQGSAHVKVSSPIQTFSLFVTAEPYFAVRVPSELVVMENELRPSTKGKRFVINNYPLMTRARYQKLANPLALSPDVRREPLDLFEARNAVGIARMNAADKYAPEVYDKAAASLKMSENALRAKKDRKQVISMARQAVQFSEDALTLSVQRQEEEREANDRRARELAERKAREDAEQEAIGRAQAEAARARAEAAQLKAQLAQEAARSRAEQEALRRAQAEAEKQRAVAAEDEARRLLRRSEEEKTELRARLLKQFSVVLETQDTERGLVVNMPDVLFDSGKHMLRYTAREKLARIAGIVVNYPKLKLEAEGHTDNVGSEEYNLKLSERRAAEVRDYLITQGVPVNSITWAGRGFSVPVAPNTTAAGRQRNRRVELIVSGEVIGTSVNKIEP